MELWISIRMLVTMSVLTGLLYPLGVTLVGQGLFAKQANGSLLNQNQKVSGSALIAQKFTQTKYFWPRPSAGDYATVASGASNKGPTSADLKKAMAERADALRKAHGLPADARVPQDLLMASGSGLDPHISPKAAYFQVSRVAQTRKISVAVLKTLVDQMIEPRQLGILGEARVNVLMLNLALDQLKPVGIQNK